MSSHPSLKAMAEGKVEGVQKATSFKVDPYLVEFEEGFNLRELGPALDAHLESMYQAMKAGAFMPPIDVTVEDGRIIVRDGHCRTKTARRLKDEGIPYLLEARQFRGNEVERVFHMLGSAQGKPLTPLESGRGFARLVRYGLTVAEICRQTGLSRTTVDNGLILAQAPVEIQMLLTGEAISVQVALEALAKHGAKAAEVLRNVVAKAVASGVTKVTKKHVTGPKITKTIAMSFYEATTAIRKTVDTGEVALNSLDDDTMVEVPAGQLKALLRAHGEVVMPQSENDNEL